MVSMKTRERDRDNLAKYIIAFPKKRKLRDVRDYIIPTSSKRKRNISGNIDKILYGAGRAKGTKAGPLYILKPELRPEPDIRDYIIPMKKVKSKKKARINEIDKVVYEL